MSLQQRRRHLHDPRFPRVSGDEPRLLDCPALYKWFSPRERG